MSEFRYCCGCLDTQVTFNKLNNEQNEFYIFITSIEAYCESYMCSSCYQQLNNSKEFVTKCQKSDSIVKSLLTADQNLTIDKINKLRNETEKLTSEFNDPLSELKVECAKNIELESMKDNVSIKSERSDEFENEFTPNDDTELNECKNESDDEFTNLATIKEEMLNQAEKNMKKDKRHVKSKQNVDQINNQENEFTLNTECKNESDNEFNQLAKIKEDIVIKTNKKKMKKKPSNRKKAKSNRHCLESTANENFVPIRLSNKEILEMFLQRKDSRTYKRAAYKCELCFKGFVSKETYSNHYKTTHDESVGKYMCDICKCRRVSKHQLFTHMKNTHLRIFKCKHCEQITYSREAQMAHQDSHNGLNHLCHQCGKIFKFRGAYLSHMRFAHATPYVCNVCGDNFLTDKGVTLHKWKTHQIREDLQVGETKPDEYHCMECNVTFTSRDAYDKHILNSNIHSKDWRCLECNEMFSESKDYMAHCNMRHNTKLSKRLIYKRAKPVIKEDLPRRSAGEEGGVKVRKHRSRTYDYEPKLGYSQSYFRDNCTEVSCQLCGKVMQAKSMYNHHRSVHLGIKPTKKKTKCTHCDKMFFSRFAVRIHVNSVHLNERSFSCEYCTKTFKSQWALKIHMQNHTGVKMYQCDQCDKAYQQKLSLRIHVQRDHLGMAVVDRHAKYRRSRQQPIISADSV